MHLNLKPNPFNPFSMHGYMSYVSGDTDFQRTMQRWISNGRTTLRTRLPLGIYKQVRIVRKDDPQPSVELFQDHTPHSVHERIRAYSTFDIVVRDAVKVVMSWRFA